jgi:hypothetical protein
MSINNFVISPFTTERRTTIGGGTQNINQTSTFNVSTVVTGNPDNVGFCIQGNPNGLDGTTDDVMRLWIDNIRTTQGFAINPTGTLLLRPENNDITMLGTPLGSMVLNLTGGVITAVSNVSSNNDLTLQSGNDLIVNSTANMSINSNNGITMTVENGNSITLQPINSGGGVGNINLDSPNINSYTYSMPICFDFLEIDRNYNYTTGGQAWEQMWQQSLNLPPQFFVDNPQSSYTSTRWKIDFTMNTWSNGGNSNGPDKALAFYIDFLDQNSNIYSTLIFDKNKPYCYHNNNSTWSQGGSISQLMPHTWSDYIDFQPIVGTGSGNLPLKFNLYISADNPRQFDFSYQMTLTRINLI